MLLWASVQAVPASLESPLTRPYHHLRVLRVEHATTTIGTNCTSLNDKPCQLFDDKVISKRMKSRGNVRVRSQDDNNTNEPIIKSSKDLHERQVRSFEHSNKITKNKHLPDRETFVSYEKATTSSQDFIRNISFGESVNEIMNNGASVSVSEATLAFKESDVKTNAQKEASDKIYLHVNGSLKLVFVLLTVLGILIPIASIIYCFWTTRRSASLEQAQRRLADSDNNLLNQSLPDFEALMLSVQNLGCAGMERLGIPANTAMGAPLSSQRDDSRSIRRSTFPIQHDLIISANRQTQNLLDESKTESQSGIKSEAFESYKRRNIYTSCSSNTNCPPHIYRHDGEFGRDRYSSSLSQHNAEIKRNYIQAPPNKSIQDVPDATQRFQTSSGACFVSHSSQRQLTHSKNDKVKMGEKVKGFFMKIIDNGNSSAHKVGNADSKQLNSNIASMPRSQSSNVSTDTSNVTKADCSELVLNGSTNFNIHSKSSNDSDRSVNLYSKQASPSPGSAAAALKLSSSSSSSSAGPSPEHNSCL